MVTTPAGHPGMAEFPSSTSSSQKVMVGAQSVRSPSYTKSGCGLWGPLYARSSANEFKPECLKGLVSLAMRNPKEAEGKLEAFCS